ncbi:hypothetical protein D3C80_2208850 [compost metagenome]
MLCKLSLNYFQHFAAGCTHRTGHRTVIASTNRGFLARFNLSFHDAFSRTGRE